MGSTIVIKVKYGKTLRRFNAHVDESEQLDFDMGGLREKVLSLFNFSRDSDLILTYIDEDGDVVTLVDDEDLHDAVRQSLNPLRITVKLNVDKGGRPCASSSGSSTPMRSPQVQHSLANLNTSFPEVLKSVPEPFREAISKLSLNLLSKATDSSPGLVELIESFARMGQSSGAPVSENHAGTGSAPHSGVSERNKGKSVGKYPKAPKDDGITPDMLPNLKFEGPAPSSNLHLNLGSTTGVTGTSVTPAPGALNSDLPSDPFLSGFSSADHAAFPSFSTAADKEVVEKSGECHQTGKSDVSHAIGSTSVAPKIPAPDDSKKSVGVDASTGTADSMNLEKLDSQAMEFGDAMSNLFRFYGCPSTGMPLANDSVATHVQFPRVHPFKRSFTHSDGMGSIFHRGVRCDGCGVHPITGPRFKSKLKDDYDLCSICFSELGNESDYIRMDRPIFPRHQWSFKKPPVRPPALPHVLRSGVMKPIRPKLDSRFIQDVNVLDGTVMAPSTPFTKIWRMRNNGTIVWPQGTQLVWIGGDMFSNSPSVEVEIFADGLPAEKELDISVDFTAPELPGRYISYWRMTSPSGQKFGQRVWVLIQVVDMEDSLCDSLHGLNLNLPPVSNGLMCPEIINVNVEPMVDDRISETNNSKRTTELRKPAEVEISDGDLEQNFHIDDNLLVSSGGASNPIPPQAPSSVLHPIIDLLDTAPADPSPALSNAPSTQAVGRNNDVERTLLWELDEMGFKETELNKEILRMNEYDLERSVDDLCGVSEWDPILDELLEMGFCDEEMNRRLLKKNKGSIKHVVMDLIAGEKA